MEKLFSLVRDQILNDSNYGVVKHKGRRQLRVAKPLRYKNFLAKLYFVDKQLLLKLYKL